jgi:ferredoxin
MDNSDPMAESLEMTVTVDEQKCQGHARCFATVPEVFDVDDESGLAHVIADGPAPREVRERVRLAAKNCPEQAIVVHDLQHRRL